MTKVTNDAQVNKADAQNKFIKLGLFCSILLSGLFWVMYLFFYDRFGGSTPLMLCLFSGLSGLLFALKLTSNLAKILFTILNILLLLSWPIVLYIHLRGGF